MNKALRTIGLAGLLNLSAAPGGMADGTNWVNGLWFDGEQFVARTMYSSNGRFAAELSPEADTVDLNGGFVVPPFGEAHNHDLASDHEAEETIRNYLRDGVFYAKMQSAFSIDYPAEAVNRPDSVDVVWAFAPVTGPGGHPIRIRELFFERGYYEGVFETKETIAGIGYTEVRDADELAAKWPGLLAQNPDFIKFMLSYSEEYELRRDDPEFFGYKGLDPALAPLLVELAHGAGLRVSAHISTAADFHTAVAAGVDEVAHMPGTAEPEVIRAQDAMLAAEQGTVVITTLSLTTKIAEDYPAWYQHVMEQHKANLVRLKEAGVTIAIGSDLPYRDTSLGEATLIASLGVFSNAELLNLWAVNAPKTIFPERRIACFEAGCDASFLVLDKDPLDDFGAVKSIRLRVKQGRELQGF